MSEVKEAVNELKKFLVQFQAMQKVADVLDTIGNLEKVHSDSVVSINHYNDQVEKAKKDAESAESKLDAVVKQVREAEKLRNETVAEAEAKKRAIIKEAEKERSLIISDAKVGAKEVEDSILDKKEELRSLEREIADSRESLDAIKSDTKRLKDQLASFINK